MNRSCFDVIVIGLGAAGSAALFHASRAGASALGIDRFVPPHALGSTHGESRIIRKAYPEGSQYLPILNRAYTLWEELEQKWDTRLMHLGGCLTIGHADSQMIQAAHKNAVDGKIRHLLLSADEVHRRYPAYHLTPEQVALVDLEGGYLHPELCVRTHLQKAAAYGARCQFGTPVLSCVSRQQGHVVVKTDLDTFEASQVILSTGAWTHDFAPVPVVIERVTNSWFMPIEGALFTSANCPPFMMEEASGEISYGCPNLGHGVKVGLHYAGSHVSHPDAIDRTVVPEDRARVHRILKKIMPKAAGVCLKTTVCMYSNTPDKHYLIDRLWGNDPHITVGSACSGHGFKVSSAVGESLAALALDLPSPIDLSPFRWRWPTHIEV